MCPNCRAFISSDDRTCQYCGVTLRSQAAQQVRAVSTSSGEGFIPDDAFATFVLLLLNAGLWVISIVLSSQAGNKNAIEDIDPGTLVLLGGKVAPLIRESGQWWRLVTAGFLHGGATHILMNGWALLMLGRMTDAIYGTSRLLVIFFLATVGGFWLSLVRSPEALSVGASAGIAGLVGAMIALASLSKSRMAMDIRDRSLQSVALTALLGLLGPTLFNMRVDNWAHLGGLAAGYFAAMLMGLPRPALPGRERIWTLAAWVCVLLTVFSFIQMGMFFVKHNSTPLIPARLAPQVQELPRQQL